MRIAVTLVGSESGEKKDVLVDVDPSAPVEQLARHLASVGGTDEVGAHLWVDGQRLRPDAPIGETPLRHGARVALKGGAPRPPAPTGQPAPYQLQVVSGPDAGLVHALVPGQHVIGRSGSGSVHLTDTSVSRRHASLTMSADGVVLEDMGSSNGTFLGDDEVLTATTLTPGQLFRVGDSLLAVAPTLAADAAVTPGDDGGLDYSRPPRLLPPAGTPRVEIPEPPSEQAARQFPLIALVVPLLLGVVMAVVMKSPQYALFALMSPVMLVANYVNDRRGGKKSLVRRRQEYEEKLASAEARIEELRQEETASRRAACPDPATALRIATGPTSRLWERRRGDDDALVLRIGLGARPATIELDFRGSGERPDVAPLADVPVTMPLREVAVLGVAGSSVVVRQLARWLLLQLAVLHSPRDVGVVLLTDRAAHAEWDWLRWLPHARPADGQHAEVLVGNDSETVAARIAELGELVRARSNALRDAHRHSDPLAFPSVVILLDGARRLRALPGMAQILQDGPEVSVFAVCLDSDERLLPEECQAVVAFDDAEPAFVSVRRARGETVAAVLADQVTPRLAEEIARALAPLRDVSRDEDASQLPPSARLLDLIDLDPPTPEAIAARWAVGGRTTRAVIGAGTDMPFALDLRRDGPHGLVAGTTGSGKSELLQTIVASLAVANRPDAMTFVLVDYKGGSAFKDCVRLPHTVGMVTDLDSHLVERALTSLSAELRRREHMLADAGAKDIDDYVDLAARRLELPALPRLLLVIDEFASMARELPDFITGLVNIAQRGRSLGIHLLLATQRPSGVVSPEIRANTNLRIALRVTDAAESTDVIDAPDAGFISQSTPGRAYARLAHSSLVQFQAGRVGGRRPGASSANAVEPPFVVDLDWQNLGRPAPTRPVSHVADDVEVTDLSVLVEAVRGASAVAGILSPPSPWLPALESSVLLDELPVPPVPAGDLPSVAYGVEDLPAAQQQRAAVFDPTSTGHVLAVGAARSGRSQLLRTLAGAVAKTYSSADVHLYGIDCGNGALLPLNELPQCGAVVTRSETERATRLISRLAGEVERRQSLLASSGFADITEQRLSAREPARLPHLLVLIDRWEGFTTTLGELDNGALTDSVMTLLREGASVGVHLVITGDRSLLTGRISATTDEKLTFRLADRGDYSLLGLNQRNLPDEIAPGRAFRSETGIELQVALLAADPSGQAQAAALAELGLRARQRDGEVDRSRRPFRVDMLPSSLTFEQAWDMRPTAAGPLFGLVGVGGDELTALGPNLGAGSPGFVIAGPPKSGRSTVLVSMARSFLAGGAKVVLVAPRPSPLRDLEGQAGVLSVVPKAQLGGDELSLLLDEAGDGPVAMLIDDAEMLRDCDAEDVLRAIAKGQPGRAIVIAGDAEEICTGFSGWQVELKKARQGVLLSPQGLTDGDLVGVRLPRSLIGAPVTPGRALVHLGDGELVTVQVARAGSETG